MELPDALRRGVDGLLADTPPAELARASAELTARYRGEVKDGKWHLDAAMAARAYLAVRMPATFAAVRAALQSVADARIEFSPGSVLDVGSGPGTAVWAAQSCWPGLRQATAVEPVAAIRELGGRLQPEGLAVAWREGTVQGGLTGLPQHELVTAAYVLNELAEAERAPVVDRLWELTSGVLFLIEPGTPAGWQRILAARSALLAQGAHAVAPCPHAAACPLKRPDWCHFSRRVSRSQIHLLVKGAEAPWEDEKYSYVAVARTPGASPLASRVLAPPRHASGRVYLKLCRPDGRAEEALVTKREGERFKRARRVDWGDPL